jgi:hypothetical protein
MKLIALIQDTAILRAIVDGYEVVQFRAGMAIDADGSGGNLFSDPDFQPDTSLHYKGEPLNANEVPYVVVPPIIIQRTVGVVLGCICRVTNLNTGVVVTAVVGDVGPRSKIGEGSIQLARLVGIPENPRTGGDSRPIIHYQIWPGMPATVNGITYDLQPS